MNHAAAQPIPTIEPGTDARLARWALPLALAWTIAAFAVAALLEFPDDEGMLAYQASRAFVRAPLASFFFLKFRPVGAVIGAPGALFGWSGFLVWSKLVAGASVYLLLRAIARFSSESNATWLGALLVLTSPVLFLGALAGHSNLQAVGAFALAINLILSSRTAWAAFVLGALPLIRYEYAPWSIALGLHLLATPPQRRAWLAVLRGGAPFPILFTVAGALYHHDALWILHYPPALALPEATSQMFDEVVFDGAYIASSLLLFTLVSPAWPLAFALRLDGLNRLGRTLLVTLTASFVLMYLFPFTRIFKFDHTPRYWLVLLPAFALLVPSLRLGTAPAPRLIVPAIAAACGAWLAVRAPDRRIAAAAFVALIGPLAVLLVGRARRRAALPFAALAALATLTLSFRAQPLIRAVIRNSLPRRGLEDAVAWLAAHRGEIRPGTIYTNSQQLDALLDARGLADLGPVRFLAHYDIQYELFHLLDKENGQYARVLAALEEGVLYGQVTWTCELAAMSSFGGAVFITSDDYRLGLSFPAGYWERVSTEVARFGFLTVRRGRVAPPPASSENESVRLFDQVLTAPCERPDRQPRSATGAAPLAGVARSPI